MLLIAINYPQWCISNFPVVVAIVIWLTGERLSFVASELNGLRNVRVKEISFSIISEFPRYHQWLKAIFAVDFFLISFPNVKIKSPSFWTLSFQNKAGYIIMWQSLRDCSSIASTIAISHNIQQFKLSKSRLKNYSHSFENLIEALLSGWSKDPADFTRNSQWFKWLVF